MGHDVTILEQHDRVGGINRSWEERGVFVEPAPCVVSSKFHAFRRVLALVGIDFAATFNIPHHGPDLSSACLLRALGVCDTIVLLVALYRVPAVPETASVHDVCRGMLPSSIAFLDDLCRALDGTGIERFRFSQLRAHARQPRETLLLPGKPLSAPGGLFARWQAALVASGVTVLTSTRVLNVFSTSSSKCRVLALARGVRRMILDADTVVLAMPPVSITRLGIPLDEDFHRLARETLRREHHATVVFQFDHGAPRAPLSGCSGAPPPSGGVGAPPPSWGVRATVKVGYGAKFVISAAATRDVADHRGQRPSTCSAIYLVLGMLDALPEARRATGLAINRRVEPAYAHVVGTAKFDAALPLPNLYTTGSHTARGGYPSTTIETAVTGAFQLVQRLLGQRGFISEDTPV